MTIVFEPVYDALSYQYTYNNYYRYKVREECIACESHCRGTSW